MIGPQLILWSFLIVLPISAFVWSFLLVYPWHHFRRYVIGHVMAVFMYCLLARFFGSYEADPDSTRAAFWLVVAGYSHCLLGTFAAFVIRKKYLHYV